MHFGVRLFAVENFNDNKKNSFGWLEIVAWICAIIAFAPACVWLYGALAQSGQLRDAIVILISALAVLSVEYKIRPHKPKFSRLSAQWLFFGYIAIFLARYLDIWGVFLALAGFSSALIAFGVACFDKRRYVYAGGASFYAFTVLSFFTHAFDLPLRVLAGKLSAYILSFFNKSVALLAYGGESAQIALKVDGKSYLVATECNGFGIILGCIVLSVIAVFFRKNIGYFKRISIIAISAMFAYLMNSLRIVAIISLAPIVGSSNYHLMHETMGYTFFAISLISVWQLARKI